VAFANSGAPSAQPPFQRGLALLHSFEYDEAAEAFRDAQRADSSFAMAFWGEAVTYSHLLWGEDDPSAARRALERLAPTRDARLARAGSARERAYGTAIEALYADGDLASRVRGFADGMRQVAATYPDDPDAAALTSLALMFSGYVGQLPDDARRAAREDAIVFAERVFKQYPQHPGGVHYLIHATDEPALAARGLEAARRYAALAPEAEHALHMPSHIFVQLGIWDDAVASNERAWAASRAEVASRKLSNADLSFHSLQWLQYGYLQQGRYGKAHAIIDTAREVLAGVDLSNPTHADARYTTRWLRFTYAANTGDWSGAICEPTSLPPAVATPSDRERAFRNMATYQAIVSSSMCGRADGTVEAIRARVAAMPADQKGPLLDAAVLHARLIAATRGDAGDLETLVAEASAVVSRPGRRRHRKARCRPRRSSSPASRSPCRLHRVAGRRGTRSACRRDRRHRTRTRRRTRSIRSCRAARRSSGRRCRRWSSSSSRSSSRWSNPRSKSPSSLTPTSSSPGRRRSPHRYRSTRRRRETRRRTPTRKHPTPTPCAATHDPCGEHTADGHARVPC
jgi:hypothetical protein